MNARFRIKVPYVRASPAHIARFKVRGAHASLVRTEEAPVLDEGDLEVARLLESLGLNRAMARIVVYLSHTTQAAAADLERGAGLRQPEVSVAMQRLRARKWVTWERVKGGGKGRPSNLYRALVPLAGILDGLERERVETQERDTAAVERLRALLPS